LSKIKVKKIETSDWEKKLWINWERGERQNNVLT
jgi:hypothetical protein